MASWEDMTSTSHLDPDSIQIGDTEWAKRSHVGQKSSSFFFSTKVITLLEDAFIFANGRQCHIIIKQNREKMRAKRHRMTSFGIPCIMPNIDINNAFDKNSKFASQNGRS